MSKIPMYKHELLSTFNKAVLDLDPMEEVILATVQTDGYGVPIGIDSVRRLTDVVDNLLKIVNEYNFESFVLHFDYAYNQVNGIIRGIPGGYKFDVLAWKDCDDIMVDGGSPNDVPDSV